MSTGLCCGLLGGSALLEPLREEHSLVVCDTDMQSSHPEFDGASPE